MSVIDNINDGKYENKVPYSIEPMDIDENKITIAGLRKLKEDHDEAKKKQRLAHLLECGRLLNLFREDFEKEHGISDHPKAQLLWAIAYDRGHSFGYSEIANCYDYMAELLKS